MAEQLDQSMKGAYHQSEGDLFNDLFGQITHDIRVPVTGLKMLWPMLEDAEPEEQQEILDYLKSSSYELFELIENLALVLSDYELSKEEFQLVSLSDIMTGVLAHPENDLDFQMNEPPSKPVKIRKKHFTKCLELACSTFKEVVTEVDGDDFILSAHVEGDLLCLKLIGPSIEIPGDKYSTRVQYSLFNKAKGNTRLSGFVLLRLKNLLNMINGSIDLKLTAENSEMEMRFPLN